MHHSFSWINEHTRPGLLLLLATLLALAFKNSPLATPYDSFLAIPLHFATGPLAFEKSLLHWINDGLMAIFFLLIGLEIKREVTEGHLSTRQQFLLPFIAALGGVIVPALIFIAINLQAPENLRGWAIPMATDIAFALGVCRLMGDRVPAALRVVLVALATLDDLMAILVIAFFYTGGLAFYPLALAALTILGMLGLNRLKIRSLWPYLLLGVMLWVCVLKSGVHATLAGVITGLLIPMTGRTKEQPSPLKKLEHTLSPFVAYGILPLFAFANAGVPLAGISAATFLEPLTLGIIAGLVIGKPLGVMAASYGAKALGLVTFPTGVGARAYLGMACLTGIGFTMSLFIGGLSFSHPETLDAVRLGVLSASFLATLLGLLVLQEKR